MDDVSLGTQNIDEHLESLQSALATFSKQEPDSSCPSVNLV